MVTRSWLLRQLMRILHHLLVVSVIVVVLIHALHSSDLTRPLGSARFIQQVSSLSKS